MQELKHYCDRCKAELGVLACKGEMGGKYCSTACAKMGDFKKRLDLNEPEHYHKHEMDTIDFLQKGFPPSVFKGFALGSAIKYLHRYENKNGIEDLEKAKDYIQRLILFHKGEKSNDSN